MRGFKLTTLVVIGTDSVGLYGETIANIIKIQTISLFSTRPWLDTGIG
jgi:hypothetical protein